MSTTLVIFTFCISFGHASWWHPHPHMAWNYVISERHINTTIYGNMFVVDLYVDKRIIENFHRDGKKVICHFSAGTIERWRKDAGQFPHEGLGAPVKGYPSETWVDIMNIKVRRIMRARIELAISRHCDGIDPDNLFGWEGNVAGLHLTPENQLDYNRYLANVAHENGLAIGLSDDREQLSDLVGDFDFAIINLSCVDFSLECHKYKPFFDARKPVFNIHSVSSIAEGHQKQDEICSSSKRPHDMNTIIKHDATNWKLAC